MIDEDIPNEWIARVEALEKRSDMQLALIEGLLEALANSRRAPQNLIGETFDRAANIAADDEIIALIEAQRSQWDID